MWIDLVDHGGGGLETHTDAVISMPCVAQAIAGGIALHAKEHPEDVNCTVNGVVANQWLMSTMGSADALSRVEVAWVVAPLRRNICCRPEDVSLGRPPLYFSLP